METSENEALMQSIDELSPDLNPKQKKKLADAIENQAKGIPLKDSLGINKDTMKYFYSHGYNLFTKQKYVDAAKMFQTLYLLDPIDPKYALGIAASFQMAKNYQNAIAWYLTLSMIDEESPLPFYYISDCFLKMDYVAASHGFLNKTIERCGEWPQYSNLKMRAIMMKDTLEEKIEEEEKSSKKDLT